MCYFRKKKKTEKFQVCNIRVLSYFFSPPPFLFSVGYEGTNTVQRMIGYKPNARTTALRLLCIFKLTTGQTRKVSILDLAYRLPLSLVSYAFTHVAHSTVGCAIISRHKHLLEWIWHTQWLIFVKKKMCSNLLSNSKGLLKTTHYIEIHNNKLLHISRLRSKSAKVCSILKVTRHRINQALGTLYKLNRSSNTTIQTVTCKCLHHTK